MSRSGYNDDGDIEYWDLIRWHGAVASAIRGARGQAFLREMLAALDALAEKKLISEDLEDEYDGSVCALGAVGRARGLDMKGIDPEDGETVAGKSGIATAMAKEIVYENDEGCGYWKQETPEARFARIRAWVVASLKPDSHAHDETA